MNYQEGAFYLYKNVKVKLVKIVGTRGIIDLNGQEISVNLYELKPIF